MSKRVWSLDFQPLLALDAVGDGGVAAENMGFTGGAVPVVVAAVA